MSNPEELVSLFEEVAADVDGVSLHGITRESIISELGVDSLHMMQIVGEIEERLHITIPDDELTELVTIGDFVKVVDAHRPT